MKKALVSIALVFGVAGAYAQDLTSKKGEPILPETGDWAISVDATPFLDYFGNMLSSGGNSAPTWEHLNPDLTIIGKMFKDEKTAYRGILRIGMESNTVRAMSAKATSTVPSFPTLPEMTEDSWKQSTRNIGLGAGLEMRKGKTRLQGYYGADALLWLSGTSDKFEYGNAVSPSGTPVVTPSDNTYSHNFFGDGFTALGNSGNLNAPSTGGYNDNRLLSMKRSTFGFGVRAFIGAEYFIFPKISIGGDFGWGVSISSNSPLEWEYEAMSGTSTNTITEESGKSGGWSLDTNRDLFGTGNGALRATFHF